MNTPRVSVIMPAYNAERFIARAIESVLSQTFPDWELIVVDDGSTDGTAEVLADLTDPRIRMIRQANGGEAVARNRGLDAVTGEYVAFLDADDLYLPNALADMVQYLNTHPEVAVLLSDGYFCDEHGKPLMRLSEHRPGPYTGDILEPLVLSASVISGIICTMSRRTTIERSGVRFDPALVIGPDWDFWIQLARHAQFGYLDRLTCMYRMHQTNITTAAGAQRRRADLVRGRLKVLNADWFPTLSLSTQRTFFYGLLTDLLAADPQGQEEILQTSAFGALSAAAQADLLRRVAGGHLSHLEHTAFAVECLRRSLILEPASRKGRVLFLLATRRPGLAAVALSAWGRGRKALAFTRSFGRHGARPVPGLLQPGKQS